MKKRLILIFLLFFTNLSAFDLDVATLMKKISKDPKDVKNRLVLARYFLEKNQYERAEVLLKKILKIEPSNKYAKSMMQKIKAAGYISSFIQTYKNLDNSVEELYKKNRYKELIEFYKNLDILYPSKDNLLKDSSFVKIARVAMWEGKYNLSLKVLERVKDKKSLDFFEIKAADCYYLSKLKCAKRYYQYLFQATGDLEYGRKLLDIYIANGEIEQAKKILFSLKRIKKSNNLILKYQKKIDTLEKKHIQSLWDKYKREPTFENMQALVFALYNEEPQKAVNLVKTYIKENPSDKKAKLFLAKLLSWRGNNKEAMKLLTDFQESDNNEAKLLFGKILAWQGEYDRAVHFLSDVYTNGTPKQKYEAKKMLGYIYLWRGQKEKAKEVFKSLLKENFKDEEVKESLLVIKGDVRPLIKKYEKELAKNPADEIIILKLADYYYMIKEYEKAAKYYEKYLKLHPEKIEIYKTLGDIYLELKQYYKGFGYWEYYANSLNTKESFYQLAQRYYWRGFNNEALSVLNDLLKKYPDYKDAIILKAKILKINPRFVTSSSSATIDEYFQNRSKKILALADRVYFANLYESAASYYKTYLMLEPEDYDAREKYAYALEFAKDYAKAAGEFYLLLWMKKTPQIEYHYAYNLQKTGEIKKAEKIYKKLIKEVPKTVPPFIHKFLQEWKKAWESMDIKQYISFYDKKIAENTGWRLRKEALFRKNSFVSVGIYDPLLIYQKENLYRVRFYQVYASKIKKDEGYKTLLIKCKNNRCKILKESWKPGKYIPYKKNSSLEFYIKERLNEIEKNSYKKDNIKKSNDEQSIKYKDIEPDKSINKDPEKKDIALNSIYLEPKKLNIKDITPKIYMKKDNVSLSKINGYKWEIEGDLDYFHDNQDIDMLTHKLKISKNIYNDLWIYAFLKGYNLTDKNKHCNGNYYGIGVKKDNYYGDVIFDKSSSNDKIGWSLGYNTQFLENSLTFKLDKKNLVYSRRTCCSKELERLKAEMSGYRQLNQKRGLWWSLAYENIEDKNQVITPQFDYEFYDKSFGKLDTIYFLSGWYQFNSKTTSCYYSPDKIDNNLIGIKAYYPVTKKLTLQAKGALGYSFLEQTLLYQAGLWLKSNTSVKYFAEIGCDFSNSSTAGAKAGYQSLECGLHLRKMW